MFVRRYTFRLYPNATQAAALDDFRRRSCWLYNALIEQRRDAWDRRRKSLTRFDQGRELTLLANDPDLPEWKSFPSAIRERVAERVDQAYKMYFDNVKQWRLGRWNKPFPPGPPGFQKSAEFSGFGYREMPKGWRWMDGNKVRLQGVGDIKVRGRFPSEPADLRTADILYRNGRWEISIVGKFEETGRMSRPTEPFPNAALSNSLRKTLGCMRIRCSDLSFEGEMQEKCETPLVVSGCSDLSFEGEMQGIDRRAGGSGFSLEGEAQGEGSSVMTTHVCSDPSLRRGVQDFLHTRQALSRGKKNATRRWRNRIAKRDHEMHEYTSWLAANGGDITIERPTLRKATKTAKGDAREHGAMVDFKAKMNRDLLDMGIGKFCEMLAYKIEALGNTFKVVEVEDHDAMVPQAVVELAKAAKKVRRVVKKAEKRVDTRPDDAVSSGRIVESANQIRVLDAGQTKAA